MLRVAEVHVGRAQQDAERAGEQQQREQREREQRDVRPRDVPPDEREHGEQHEALQEEVHEHAADRGQRQDLARERDLLHEPGVARRPTRTRADRPVEKRFHTSRPDSRKIGNAGTPEPRIFTNAM